MFFSGESHQLRPPWCSWVPLPTWNRPRKPSYFLETRSTFIHAYFLYGFCGLPWTVALRITEDQTELGTKHLPDRDRGLPCSHGRLVCCPKFSHPTGQDDSGPFASVVLRPSLLFHFECRACRFLSLTPIIWRSTDIWRVYMLSVHPGHLGFFHDYSRMFCAALHHCPWSVSHIGGAVLTQTAVES